jgi:hypothetical protein
MLAMKKIMMGMLPLLLMAIMAFTLHNEVLPIGSSLPMEEVKMKDISGKEVSFKDAFKENGLLVMFSCNTCPFVIKHQQQTKAIATYALQNQVGVILVNSNEGYRNQQDSFEAMKAYAAEQEYHWFYSIDKHSKIADAFGATMTPECFIFYKNKKLVYHGAINDRPRDPDHAQNNYLKKAMDEMLNGKTISTSTYPQLGCSIKRIN